MGKKHHRKADISSNLASYVCLENNCGEVFTSKFALNRHKRCHLMQAKSVEVVHDEETSDPDTKDNIIYICLESGCGVQFDDKLKFDLHQLYHASGSTTKSESSTDQEAVWKNNHNVSQDNELTIDMNVELTHEESECSEQETLDNEVDMGMTPENVVKIEPYSHIDMAEDHQNVGLSMPDSVTQSHFCSELGSIAEEIDSKEQETRITKMEVDTSMSQLDIVKSEPYGAADVSVDGRTVSMNETGTHPLVCSEIKSDHGEQVLGCFMKGTKVKDDADCSVHDVDITEYDQPVSVSETVKKSPGISQSNDEQLTSCKMESTYATEIKIEPDSPYSDLDMNVDGEILSRSMTTNTSQDLENLHRSNSTEDLSEDDAHTESSVTTTGQEEQSSYIQIREQDTTNEYFNLNKRKYADEACKKDLEDNSSKTPKKKTHKAEVKCPKCEYSMTHTSKMVRHLVSHNKVPCIVCGRKTFKPYNDDDPVICGDDRLENRYLLAAKAVIKRSQGDAAPDVSEALLVSALKVDLSKIIGNFTEADDQNTQPPISGSSGHVLTCSKCPDFASLNKCGLEYHNKMLHDIINCTKCNVKLLLQTDRIWLSCEKCRSSRTSISKPNEKRKSFLCPYCSMRFSLECYRKKHVNAVHLKLSVSCPVGNCSKKYASRSGLVVHLKLKHASEEIVQELQCKECDYIAFEKTKLSSHINKFHNGMEDFSEDIADIESSVTTTNYEQPSSDTHNRELDQVDQVDQVDTPNQCQNANECKSSGSSASIADEPSRRDLGEKSGNTSKSHEMKMTSKSELKCPKCELSITPSTKIARHLLTHNQVPCVVCGRRTFKPDNDEDPVVCCDEGLKRRYSLAAKAVVKRSQDGAVHGPNVSEVPVIRALTVNLSKIIGNFTEGDDPKHDTYSDPSGVLTCPKCPDFTTSKKCGLNYHNNMLHDIINCIKCNIKLLLQNDRKRMLCEKCRIPTPKKNNKAFICPYCNDKFSSSFVGRKHVEVVHLKQSVVCPVESCAKKYFSRSGLVEHIKHTHASEEIFQELQCKDCDYIAIEKKRLASHIDKYHKSKGRKKSYSCDRCEYSTNSDACIRKHMKIHGLPPCVICGRTTFRGVRKPEDGDLALCWHHRYMKEHLISVQATSETMDHSQSSRVSPGDTPVGNPSDCVGKNTNQNID